MRKNYPHTLFTLVLLVATVAFQCRAWTIFGSREDALEDQLRSGDKFMLKADAAFEAGKMSRASNYYTRAIKKYEILKEADPGFMDGIASIRLAYCAKQYTNALEAVAAAAEEAAAAAAAAEETAKADSPAGGSPETDVKGEKAKVPPPAETTPPAAQAVAAAVTTATAKDNSVTEKTDSRPVAAPAKEKASETDAEADEVEEVAPPPRPAYDPRNFAHDFAEARMLMEDGNLSEAAAVLIPMLRYDPSNRQVRLMIAIVRTRQGRYDEAIVALEDLRGIREDLPILLALSGAYMGASRYHDALLALDSAIKLKPSDPNAFLNLAWLTLVMPSEPNTLKNAEIYYRQAIRHGAARDRTLEARIGLKKW